MRGSGRGKRRNRGSTGRTVGNREPLKSNKEERHHSDRDYWETINHSESENQLWDAIKNSNDAQKFREYLKAFPNGVFSVIARDRLRKMKEDQALKSLFRGYE